MACAAIFALSGCSGFTQANNHYNEAQDNINSQQPPSEAPMVTNVSNPYLIDGMVSVQAPPPKILETTTITMISSDAMTLDDIASKITASTGISVINQDTESKNDSSSMPSMPGMSSGMAIANGSQQGMEINYSGSLEGFLNYLQSKYSVYWKFSNGSVNLYTHETQTFTLNIASPALTQKTSIVANAGGALGNNTSTSSGGSSNTENNGNTTIDINNGSDVWKDINASAVVLAGAGAQVSVDPSLKQLTVYGTPPQVQRVADWVNNLNETNGQQVEIDVHVYSVQLNNQQGYGFQPNLSAIAGPLGRFGFTTSGPSMPTFTGGVSPFNFGVSVGSGNFKGTAGAIEALATLGKVSETFEQSLVTMNNQPVPIQVAQNTGYLAAVETTSTANVGSSTSLTPGNITTGFTGMFTPSLVNGRVVLNMEITLSSLTKLTTATSGDNSIQVPTSTNSEFDQSVSLRPGQTLLLTGYKQNDGSTQHNGVGSPFFFGLGGGANASTSNQIIAIVITTKVLPR